MTGRRGDVILIYEMSKDRQVTTVLSSDLVHIFVLGIRYLD